MANELLPQGVPDNLNGMPAPNKATMGDIDQALSDPLLQTAFGLNGMSAEQMLSLEEAARGGDINAQHALHQQTIRRTGGVGGL